MRTRGKTAAIILAASLILTACSGKANVDSGPEAPAPSPVVAAQAQVPDEDSALVRGTHGAELALDSVGRFFKSASVVILAPAGDTGSVLEASSLALAIGAPVLLTGPQDQKAQQQVKRLDAQTLLTVGNVDLSAWKLTGLNVQPVPATLAELKKLFGSPLADTLSSGEAADGSSRKQIAELKSGEVLLPTEAGEGEGSASSSSDSQGTSKDGPPKRGHMPALLAGEPATGAAAIFDGSKGQVAAIANARAAGAKVTLIKDGLLAHAKQIRDLGKTDALVGYSTSYGSPNTFAWRTAVARGPQLPGGDYEIFDHKRYVAIYGHPGTTSLGLLGEQGKSATIKRAEKMAKPYRSLTKDTIVPTLEIIVTVASGAAGADGDYSNEPPASTYLPLIKAAQKAGQYVVLDFQPGRDNFLDQVKQYSELLDYPNVGVALDPEWRLTEKQKPLEQIGSVSVTEINDVIDYVAQYTRKKGLPQKMVALHQFRTSMITARSKLDLSHPEVAVLIHADGSGAPTQKKATWRSVRANAPKDMHWGWKNFIDEDHPMLSPKQTYAISPRPDYVSYQ